MNKFLTALFASLFIFCSNVALAGEDEERDHTNIPMSAQDILNKMACEDKKPGEKIKDRTTGEMVTCHQAKKGEKEKSSSGGGY